ncbi:MAG: hypothetical protein H0V54_14490 [Chthoniobacterales bacterium]|nr:hypothetical protein [Chthoniobacterales bacterium]
MLVSIAVLTILILFVTRLLDHATNVISLGSKRMDAESTVRPLFDRMALDFANMVKRPDVSYYLKTSATSMPGNDRLAFFSGIPGYYDDNGRSYNSRFSVVSYRVNTDPNSASFNRIERMGKGLALNATYTDLMPILFLDSTVPTNNTTTLDALWPSATRASPDPNYYSSDTYSQYEIIGSQAFRLEYYYLTSGGSPTLTGFPTDWTSVDTIAIKDISAIVVAVAIIDPQSNRLLSSTQISTLAASLPDFNTGTPGSLLASWQAILNNTANMPRPGLSGIRLYERYFYLSQ